ncbi:hypothetical protein Mal15_05620 [Stieleria maiorica]|uniref:YcxB-like protein domain-containing protein n=1 Tax=Stieleria maiorica TaxID=2795974 RepID=A0A5B9MAG1_9BACT|nr:hypothetical protein [Stieleria maiorica]QEF96534.1 hypothetical protein Mal15_05620 [Stieleria maiorica]
MTNPYRAPVETHSTGDETDAAAAEFLVTARQLRFAESKFLLYRCGGRLTLASFVMIALSLLVAVDLSSLPLPTAAAVGPTPFPLVLRELAVMGLATVVYLSLILSVRKTVRAELASHGIVDGAGLSVVVKDRVLGWSGPQGVFSVPLNQSRPIRTRKGMIVVVDRDLFLFIPKEAAFAGGRYQDFARALVA